MCRISSAARASSRALTSATKLCFGTIAHTICDYLGVDASTLDGQSVLGDILA